MFGCYEENATVLVERTMPVRLSKIDIDIISSELINLKKTFPAEFCRLPRSLEEVEFWKATEYRSFLLYTGPIVLKGRLKKNSMNISLLFIQLFAFLHLMKLV